MRARTAKRKAIERYVRWHMGRVEFEHKGGGARYLPPCVLRQWDREDRRRRYAYDMRSKRPVVSARIWQKWGMPERMAEARAEVRAAWAYCEQNHVGHDVFMCAWQQLHRRIPNG